MKESGMLKKAVRIFSVLKAKVAGEDKLGNVDSAVLKVAMMVSALDGDVSKDELDAFGKLARQCRGYSAEEADKVFDAGLRSAGYIALQAKRLPEKKLVNLFLAEANEAMPDGFALANPEDVRRAFVMWVTMSLADGAFSPIERKAIDAFRKHLDAITNCVNAYNESRGSTYSPACLHAFVIEDANFRFKSATTDTFMANVEKLVAKLNREATAEAAAKELKALIVQG